MSRTLYDSLFTNCSCSDCVHSEYDCDREQFYCRIDGRYRDGSDNSPCSNFED